MKQVLHPKYITHIVNMQQVFHISGNYQACAVETINNLLIEILENQTIGTVSHAPSTLCYSFTYPK